MEREKLETTLLSERSTVPLSEIRKSEGRGGDAWEEKINFDLSTLNTKCLADRKKCLSSISGLGLPLFPPQKGKKGNGDLESHYIDVTLKMRSSMDTI